MPTLEELLQMEPGGSALPERPPIGVPEGYSATGKRPAVKIGGRFGKKIAGKGVPQVTTQIPPRYFDGDELGPAGLSPTDIARIQADLVAAGLLKGKYRKGFWDANSQKAYAQALGYANQSGRSVKAALAELKTHPEAAGEDEERPPLVIKTTSPDDLRGVFRDTSRKLLGRQLAPQELDQFIAAYNQVETQKQQEAYNLDPTGGKMADIPTASSYVEERVRREKPGEFMAHEEVQQYEQFLQLLGAD